MSRRGLTALAAAALALTAPIGAGAKADPAVVEIENLVLKADGGFVPRTLPKRQFSPIDFQGRVEIGTKDGSPPSPLRQVIVDFDRDGRLTAGGLPTCAPEVIANSTPRQARRACGGAQVGTGHVRAAVSLPGGAVSTGSPLTLFNGPRQDGDPTVVVHAQTTVPAVQTYAIVVPIERRRGDFRYRAVLNLPPLAGGLGAITHLDVKIGRRFTAGGKRRSYTAARCTSGVLRTHGRFSFADGMVIDGSVEKPCTVK